MGLILHLEELCVQGWTQSIEVIIVLGCDTDAKDLNVVGRIV